MKSLFRSLLSLLFLVCLLAGVAASLLYPISKQRHVALVRVTERIAPPPPPAPDAPDNGATPPAPSLSVQHQTAGAVDGQLLIARYAAEDETRLRLHVPDPDGPALSPGVNPRSGPPHQTFTPGGWWSSGDGNAFTLRLPLIWVAAIGLGVAVIGYGSRTIYRFFTTERKPSAVCLHCNQRFEDFDAEQCPGCGADRAKVTVSKVGRPV